MARRLLSILKASSGALLVAAGLLGAGLLLGRDNWQVFSVQSGSMEPALSRGDLVLVHRVPASDYRVGDVITFINPEQKNQTITHRIVEVTEGGRQVFQTKGDANATADRPINELLVIGKQVAGVPFAGRAVDFVRTWPGLLAVIYIPALFIIGSEIRRLSDYYRRFRPYALYGHTTAGMRGLGYTRPAVMVAIVLTSGLVFGVLSGTGFALATTRITVSGNTLTLKAQEPPPQESSPANIPAQSDQAAPASVPDTSQQDTSHDYEYEGRWNDGPRRTYRRSYDGNNYSR